MTAPLLRVVSEGVRRGEVGNKKKRLSLVERTVK
jgi:hypothetical protein